MDVQALTTRFEKTLDVNPLTRQVVKSKDRYLKFVNNEQGDLTQLVLWGYDKDRRMHKCTHTIGQDGIEHELWKSESTQWVRIGTIKFHA